MGFQSKNAIYDSMEYNLRIHSEKNALIREYGQGKRRETMTLKQLRYIDEIARKGSITEAARSLFVAQPSLTDAVHTLEAEMGITIFHRSREGVTLTREGDRFLGMVRQLLEQAEQIEQTYTGTEKRQKRFSVSSQHYSFAVEAFVRLLRENGGDAYAFHMRETQTYDIISDVSQLRSEIGILYLNPFNETVIQKALHENGLKFTPLFRAEPHVFIGKNNPLAEKTVIRLEDLAPYPRLSYEQGEHNSYYFSEEILSTLECRKEIIVRDRATLFNLLVGLNGYTICSGVISEELNGPQIIARPLQVDDYMEIGYVLPARNQPGPLTEKYIGYLLELTEEKREEG